jgi:hypothetical protein
MPEYLSPGVYVEEIDAGPRPIAGVSTSTAGMVGVTVRGPAEGKPQLVTNFLEFQRTFGGFLPAPDPNVSARWALNPMEGGRWWTFPLSVQGLMMNTRQRGDGLLRAVTRVSKKFRPVPGGVERRRATIWCFGHSLPAPAHVRSCHVAISERDRQQS